MMGYFIKILQNDTRYSPLQIKGKSYIKTWRPILMINVDTKIISKALKTKNSSDCLC